jgi:predicted metallopeptidase
MLVRKDLRNAAKGKHVGKIKLTTFGRPKYVISPVRKKREEKACIASSRIVIHNITHLEKRLFIASDEGSVESSESTDFFRFPMWDPHTDH